jgi:plastocyanin
MRKHLLFTLILFVFLSVLSFGQITHKIQVANFQFTPNSITGVKIGDNIEFDWVSGDHTASSVSVPSGASSFDFQMNSGNTVGTYSVQKAGTYSFQCNIHGAAMSGSFMVDAATSIATIALNELSIEPNPAHDIVNIKIGTLNPGTVKFLIYDLIGRVVLSKDIEHNSNDEVHSIDIGNLNAGIYLLYANTGSSVSKAHRMIKR